MSVRSVQILDKPEKNDDGYRGTVDRLVLTHGESVEIEVEGFQGIIFVETDLMGKSTLSIQPQDEDGYSTGHKLRLELVSG